MGAEELFSDLLFSTGCGLLTPDTLGTEPTLLFAFFILGCLLVMHLQSNLWEERNNVMLKRELENSSLELISKEFHPVIEISERQTSQHKTMLKSLNSHYLNVILILKLHYQNVILY